MHFGGNWLREANTRKRSCFLELVQLGVYARMLSTQSQSPRLGDFYNTLGTHRLLKGSGDGNHALPGTE